MTYDNIHRFFLRTMANRGVLCMSESREVLKKFTGQNKREEDILILVEEINKQISSFKQRIIIVDDKNIESEKSLIFINLFTDMATKAQIIFKEKECQYFIKLIEDIINSESRDLKYDEVLKDINNSIPLKKEERKEHEVLIDRWCKLSYLKKITHAVEETRKENTNITLGLRAIYEFESYIADNRDHFEIPVENCTYCKKIVIMGCHCIKCGEALHKPCLDIHRENNHTNITISDDNSIEGQLDNSSISTDKEEELLKSGSDIDSNEPVPKRIRISSTDSEEEMEVECLG